MKAKKLSNLLEFKDRDQVRSLLAIALGNEATVAEILLDYIKNTKSALLGIVDGHVVQGLIGLKLLPKKEAEILHLAVRPELDNEALKAEMIELAGAKYKLKTN